MSHIDLNLRDKERLNRRTLAVAVWTFIILMLLGTCVAEMDAAIKEPYTCPSVDKTTGECVTPIDSP